MFKDSNNTLITRNKVLPTADRQLIRFALPLNGNVRNDFSKLGVVRPDPSQNLPKIRGPCC